MEFLKKFFHDFFFIIDGAAIENLLDLHSGFLVCVAFACVFTNDFSKAEKGTGGELRACVVNDCLPDPARINYFRYLFRLSTLGKTSLSFLVMHFYVCIRPASTHHDSIFLSFSSLGPSESNFV
jgi:hypothetical protein